MNSVIAIQVRTGSTRLPGKMSLPFHAGKTILELIVEQLLSVFPSKEIVVATSTNAADNELETVATKLGVSCSRGSEEDVLHRVADAARPHEADYVVRVCADNPFLRAKFISDLLKEAESTLGKTDSAADYVSFALPDGTPTILSHVGLFAEVVRGDTLQTICSNAESKRHREHLTSHILDNPEKYRRQLLPVPEYITALESLRLTVDTEADFQVCKELYDAVYKSYGSEFSAEQLISVIRDRPELLKKMSHEIAANTKR